MRNIGEIALLNARYYPNKRAVVDSPKEFTWKEVNDRTNRIANALISMGCRKGERIALLSYNSSEYVEITFACAKLGLVFVPLNFRLALKEIAYILKDSTPTTLFFGEAFSETVSNLRSSFTLNYICMGEKIEWAHEYEAFLSSGSPLEPSTEEIIGDDPAEILYTSGTTGLAKGVLHSNRARLESALTCVMLSNLDHNDAYLVNVPPLFHAAGHVWMLACAYAGASIVISNLRGFDPEAVLETIQRESITILQMVPITIMQLINFPDLDRYDFSSLRLIFYATAPMPAGPLRKAINIFGNIFMQPYGLTEAGPTVTCLGLKEHDISNLSDAEAEKRLRSCGRPCPGILVEVVDENGQEVPPLGVGEIIVKSTDILDCYWNNEAETRKAIRDGWLYTGDVATYDEDYYIYLVDRKKDMIISGGENIYPAEVERAIYEHPAVDQCAVIGVPDDQWGEAVKAFIVPVEGQMISEEELVQFCKTSLASYKKPKSVEFMDELPRSPQGKILKRVLREKYWAKKERHV
ncbi:MAG: long-chain-fatty-acid--CoA ligase [Nitrospina sp.]|nr:long-chain-fatty-acid--CoA ligase [Nitrospina sp.]